MIFSGLNLKEPRDQANVATLARHIRSLKQSVQRLTVIDATFEYPVDVGDLVYLDNFSQTWRRSQAGVIGAEHFFGVAFPNDGMVLVGPCCFVPKWGLVPGSELFLSDTDPGKIVTTQTSVFVGFAVTSEFALLDIVGQHMQEFIQEYIAEVNRIYIDIKYIHDRINIIYGEVLEDLRAVLEEMKAIQEQLFTLQVAGEEVTPGQTVAVEYVADLNLLIVKVPRGLPGEKGVEGERGPRGPNGDAGEMGEKGDPGIPGSPPLFAYLDCGYADRETLMFLDGGYAT